MFFSKSELSLAIEQAFMPHSVVIRVARHLAEPQSHSLAVPSLDTAGYVKVRKLEQHGYSFRSLTDNVASLVDDSCVCNTCITFKG